MLCILHYFPTISQNRNHSCRGQAAFIPPGWKQPDPLFLPKTRKGALFMAQLVTLGETMAAFAPDHMGPLRYVSNYGIRILREV